MLRFFHMGISIGIPEERHGVVGSIVGGLRAIGVDCLLDKKSAENHPTFRSIPGGPAAKPDMLIFHRNPEMVPCIGVEIKIPNSFSDITRGARQSLKYIGNQYLRPDNKPVKVELVVLATRHSFDGLLYRNSWGLHDESIHFAVIRFLWSMGVGALVWYEGSPMVCYADRMFPLSHPGKIEWGLMESRKAAGFG